MHLRNFLQMGGEGVCQVLKHEGQCYLSMITFADTSVNSILSIHLSISPPSESNEPAGLRDLYFDDET